jgi:hypothetical protein
MARTRSDTSTTSRCQTSADILALLTCFIFVANNIGSDTPFDNLRRFVVALNHKQVFLGAIPVQGHYHLSQAAGERITIYHDILITATCGLNLAGCFGARTAHGVQRLGGLGNVDDSLMWCRLKSPPNDIHYLRAPGASSIQTTKIHHDWQQLCVIQFLLTGVDEIDDVRRDHPHTPHLG